LQCQEQWLPNDEISSSTFHTGFRSACDHLNMHPTCVENRGCAPTWEKLKFDAHLPDQVVLSPTEAKADGSIDIIMGNRNGMTITRREKDDAIEWLANCKQKIKSASRMFDWENHLDKDSTLQARFWICDGSSHWERIISRRHYSGS
jgi:hypothetical protein